MRRNWQDSNEQLSLVPSDTMFKLGTILNELADIFDGVLASDYMPLVGNLRKLKRFVNAMILMQIEKTDLGRTDFNNKDLINLILLHLNYPGLFRRIYVEETEGRSGSFSVQQDPKNKGFINSSAFSELKENLPRSARFLLSQLFDVSNVDIGFSSDIDEAERRTRACFNSSGFRNLEAYLKLIVRFATPEPQQTFILYQKAVARVKNGSLITSILTLPDFELTNGEYSHDQFWRVLVNQSHELTNTQAADAISTLIAYIPHYSMFNNNDQGLRQRSIYSLLRLLDSVGWGSGSGRRLSNTSENVIEIAWRLFGENSYQGNGILRKLISSERGALGWYDLMIFRLECSSDRGGQLYNLQKALIVHQDNNAPTSGVVRDLALMEMRKLSQEVFFLFKQTYIDQQKNFFSEVNDVPVDVYLGSAYYKFIEEALQDPTLAEENSLARRVAITRNIVKIFVIYQLSNSNPPDGSGVGCGYYDESGSGDNGGIARLVNNYVFDICFNPDNDERNIFLFLDHCLSHLSSTFFLGRDDDGYIATRETISGGLDPIAMGNYWVKNRELIRGLKLNTSERCVFTSNYTAFYRDDLDGVFAVLDELAAECSTS